MRGKSTNEEEKGEVKIFFPRSMKQLKREPQQKRDQKLETKPPLLSPSSDIMRGGE